MVQSGRTRWATHPDLATFLCCSFQASVPPDLSRAEGPSPQLAPLCLKASPKKRKPLRDPRRQQPATFQRLGFLAERRLQSILILRQKKWTYLPAIEVEMTVPSRAGQQDQCSELSLDFAPRESAPTGEELPGSATALGSPARLLHREKGSSCKHIKQKTEWFMGRGISQHDPMFSTHVASQGSHLSISQWRQEPFVWFCFSPKCPSVKMIQFYWNQSYLKNVPFCQLPVRNYEMTWHHLVSNFPLRISFQNCEIIVSILLYSFGGLFSILLQVHYNF